MLRDFKKIGLTRTHPNGLGIALELCVKIKTNLGYLCKEENKPVTNLAGITL